MTLTFCWDLTPAAWIAHSGLPWTQLVSFGPAGFDAYARLRFLPDPVRPGQSENEAAQDRRVGQLPTLLELLAPHTATPDDCYFCVWEGFGDAEITVDDDVVYIDDENAVPVEEPSARPGVAPQPAPHASVQQVPKVEVPNRAYWLFRGPLADVGTWDSAHGWPGQRRLNEADPAFVWPGDRRWCIANDVDPHYAGIGASSPVIDQLLAHPDLDIVPADPHIEPPAYR